MIMGSRGWSSRCVPFLTPLPSLRPSPVLKAVIASLLHEVGVAQRSTLIAADSRVPL